MFHEKYLRDFLTVCETGNITQLPPVWDFPNRP